jgi:hypothetical protein
MVRKSCVCKKKKKNQIAQFFSQELHTMQGRARQRQQNGVLAHLRAAACCCYPPSLFPLERNTIQSLLLFFRRPAVGLQGPNAHSLIKNKEGRDMKLQRRKIRTEFLFLFRQRERGGNLNFFGGNTLNIFNDY